MIINKPKNIKDLDKYNPMPSFRKHQAETILKIYNNFNNKEGKKFVLLNAPTGSGKQISHSTPVLTTKGWVTHGELEVGDYVFGLDGKPKKILAQSQELQSNMKITFQRKNSTNITNFSFETHENHIWILKKRRKDSPLKEYSTKELLDKNLYNKDREKYWLPVIEPLVMDKKDLPIDPYWLGLWLGDGTKNKPLITQTPEDVDEWKNTIPYNITNEYVEGNGSANAFAFSNQGLIEKIKKLNLYENKHIPDIYKQSSIEQRLELIAGLIDSDGNKKENNRYSFSNNNIDLVKDMKEILLSLGFVVSEIMTYQNKPRDINSNGKLSYFKDTYVIVFNQRLKIPCRLKRHNIDETKKPRQISLVKVEKINNGEMGKCIQVEGGNYLIGKDLIPTHNSVIASVLGNLFDSTYILTGTKHLQHQYADEFKDMIVMKGRDNYNCKLGNCEGNKRICKEAPIKKINEACINDEWRDCVYCQTTASCDNLIPFNCKYKPVVDKENPSHKSDGEECEYWYDKIEAMICSKTVLNYHYYTPELNFVGHFDKRDLLVCDEAHNLADILVDFLGVNIDIKKIGGLSQNGYLHNELIKNDNDFDDIISDLNIISTSIRTGLSLLPKKTKPGTRAHKDKAFLKNMKDKLKIVIDQLLEDENLDNWVCKWDSDLNGLSFNIKPLWVGRYANRMIWNHASNILLMSATLNKRLTMKELGLKEEDVLWIDVPNTFPIENLTINRSFIGKMSGKPEKYLTSKLVNKVVEIMIKHPNERILVHTVSYNLNDYLYKHLSKHRNVDVSSRVLTHSEKNHITGFRKNNKNDVLAEFELEEDKVLLTPSFSEGLNLPGKIGCQIHVKIPYPSLYDDRTAKLSQMDGLWYNAKTALRFVQSVGRGIRSSDDVCVNYVLDNNFRRFENVGLFPKWWKDVIVGGGVKKPRSSLKEFT